MDESIRQLRVSEARRCQPDKIMHQRKREHLLEEYMYGHRKFHVNKGNSIAHDLTGWFLLLRIFNVAISVSPHICFIGDLILISMCLR